MYWGGAVLGLGMENKQVKYYKLNNNKNSIK